jgi:hypothetical protein
VVQTKMELYPSTGTCLNGFYHTSCQIFMSYLNLLNFPLLIILVHPVNEKVFCPVDILRI